MLVLKRLSDAERDGDRVLAVVRGSAVNQDGRSQGLTAPNGPSQQRVIGVRWRRAGWRRATSTRWRRTARARRWAIRSRRGRWRRCSVRRGATESRCTGLEQVEPGPHQAAAGVLGVMKMVLALQHERLPKTLHAEKPSRTSPGRAAGCRCCRRRGRGRVG